jgi:hypothetical protein
LIIRVRLLDGDVLVEQPRLSRHGRVGDVGQVGELIKRWLAMGPVSLDATHRPDGSPPA